MFEEDSYLIVKILDDGGDFLYQGALKYLECDKSKLDGFINIKDKFERIDVLQELFEAWSENIDDKQSVLLSQSKGKSTNSANSKQFSDIEKTFIYQFNNGSLPKIS